MPNAHGLARLAPLHEVSKRLEPITRHGRRQGIEQGDDEFGRQRGEPLVAVLLAEAFEDRPPMRRRAAGEAAEGLRLIVLGDGSGDRSRPAALAGADGHRGSGQRPLVGFHKLDGSRDPGKLDVGRAATSEVVVAAVALHVFQVKPGHRPFAFGALPFSFAISSCHSRAPAAVSGAIGISPAAFSLYTRYVTAPSVPMTTSNALGSMPP